MKKSKLNSKRFLGGLILSGFLLFANACTQKQDTAETVIQRSAETMRTLNAKHNRFGVLGSLWFNDVGASEMFEGDKGARDFSRRLRDICNNFACCDDTKLKHVADGHRQFISKYENDALDLRDVPSGTNELIAERLNEIASVILDAAHEKHVRQVD